MIMVMTTMAMMYDHGHDDDHGECDDCMDYCVSTHDDDQWKTMAIRWSKVQIVWCSTTSTNAFGCAELCTHDDDHGDDDHGDDDHGHEDDHGDDDHDEHGALTFDITGLAVGSTTFTISIMHQGHADFTSMPILVTVEEEEHCEDFLTESDCGMHSECEWHADEMACEDAGDDHDHEHCTPGDYNEDEVVDVLDIVAIVEVIISLADEYNECGDFNNDGYLDVLDIVAIVEVILGSNARSADATSATMNIANDTVSISGNGFIGAIQMTLSHGAGFSIDLTDDAMVADYRTSGNTTTLIVVAPNSDEIFTAYGDFKVEETLVASGNGYVPLSTPASFTLSAAYPNPFNPSTSLDMTMPSEGYVSIQAYNLVGQVVGTIAEGNMSAGTHSFAWDASDLSSGVYLIKAEYAGSVSTQKVMLLK